MNRRNTNSHTHIRKLEVFQSISNLLVILDEELSGGMVVGSSSVGTEARNKIEIN